MKQETLGKTKNFKTIRFETDRDLRGQFVNITITAAEEFELIGKLKSFKSSEVKSFEV